VQNEALLEHLSDSDKDKLVLRLWRDLQDERARSSALEERISQYERDGTGRTVRSLFKKLQAASSNTGCAKPEGEVHRPELGRWGDLFPSKLFLVTAVVVALFLGTDYAIGKYQAYRVDQSRLAALQLQHAAYEGLFVELVNVAYEPDQKSYRVIMRITNVEPDRPVYIMQTPLRVFEQSGLTWKEVPSHGPNGETAVVVKLVGPHLYETIFEPNLKDWTELIPGYMHIRFESGSLISQRSDPDDDIIERIDRYYVYLKPHGADDDRIRKRMNYKGDPPVYMPMPPH
jgi:hypothetical protein